MTLCLAENETYQLSNIERMHYVLHDSRGLKKRHSTYYKADTYANKDNNTMIGTQFVIYLDLVELTTLIL